MEKSWKEATLGVSVWALKFSENLEHMEPFASLLLRKAHSSQNESSALP